MAILMCKSCGYIKELPSKYLNKSVKCPKCKKDSKILDTQELVKKIFIAYKRKSKESISYKKDLDNIKYEIEKRDKDIAQYKSNLIAISEELNKLKKLNSSQKKSYRGEIKKLRDELEKIKASSKHITENISHSEGFSIQNQDFNILKDWFYKKSMNIDIDPKLMDTRGFFDEVAITLGDNFDTLKSVLEQIKYIQKKGYDTVKIPLDKRSKEEIEIIKKFSKEIYEYSFSSKYFFDKKKNAIYIEIQKAKKIVNFFNGMWMEWYIFMILLEYLEKSNTTNNIVRGIKVTYGNGDKNEFDIFLMIDSIPIVIECKSGEFRKEIRKYTDIKNRLGLKKEQFILCIVGLDTNQAEGLTNTYDITFANQKNVIASIEYALNQIENKKGFLNKLKTPFSK